MVNNEQKEKNISNQKKKHFKLPKATQFTIIGLAGIAIGAGTTYGCMQLQAQRSPLAGVEKVYHQIQNNYYQKVSDKTLEQGAVSGMLNSLKDPYSEQLLGQNQTQINNVLQGSSFGGVGIQMLVKNNHVYVDSIVSDSPASKSNIKPGDEIIAVDNSPVSASHFNEISQKVRGRKGTKVTLTLKRKQTSFKVTLTRATIKQSSLTVKTQNDATIITITQFDTNTANDLKTALKQINQKKNPKLIINLQDNPGGVMEAALQSASYFLANGQVIMRYQSRSSQKVIKASKKLSAGYKTNLKPIILINDNTASASEIFTAALVQNKRAVTVGQTSFGKGTVQEVDSSGNVEYKYTIAKWLTPNGTWINHKGIKPTYPVKPSALAELPQFQTSQVLKENMMGLDVAILQQYLTALGYLNNHLTGIFDAQTQASVIAFQKAQGLSATGQVNDATRQQLYLAVAQRLQNNDPALQKALSLKI